MSKKKKQVRENFRDAVFKRDGYKCRVCGGTADDAHHVTDRNLLPNGGYVKENGITLCNSDHEKAEIFHSTGTALPGFSPQDLYELIGSSYEQAVAASERLK